MARGGAGGLSLEAVEALEAAARVVRDDGGGDALGPVGHPLGAFFERHERAAPLAQVHASRHFHFWTLATQLRRKPMEEAVSQRTLASLLAPPPPHCNRAIGLRACLDELGVASSRIEVAMHDAAFGNGGRFEPLLLASSYESNDDCLQALASACHTPATTVAAGYESDITGDAWIVTQAEANARAARDKARVQHEEWLARQAEPTRPSEPAPAKQAPKEPPTWLGLMSGPTAGSGWGRSGPLSPGSVDRIKADLREAAANATAAEWLQASTGAKAPAAEAAAETAAKERRRASDATTEACSRPRASAQPTNKTKARSHVARVKQQHSRRASTDAREKAAFSKAAFSKAVARPRPSASQARAAPAVPHAAETSAQTTRTTLRLCGARPPQARSLSQLSQRISERENAVVDLFMSSCLRGSHIAPRYKMTPECARIREAAKVSKEADARTMKRLDADFMYAEALCTDYSA